MSRRTFVWALVLVLLTGGAFWIGRLSNRSTTEVQRISELEKENAELRASLRNLQQQPPEVAADASPDRDQPVRQPRARTESRPFDENQVIVSLRESLAAQQRALTERESRIAALEREIETVREEKNRLADHQSELDQQVASFRKQVEQVHVEVKSRDDQLAQLQAERRKLRDQATDSGQKLSRVQKAVADLQDLHRRRETHMTNLLNRYRDVNQQYRAFATVLDNRATAEGATGGTAGPELARIQNAIQLAEEEIRQLNTLNAQAQRVQKQLEAAIQ
jgi:chromosome segregation ATPase